MPSWHCFVGQTQRARSQPQFLWVTHADAEVLRLAVCELNPARCSSADRQPEQWHTAIVRLLTSQSWTQS